MTEFEINTADTHTITSNVTLCCAETGRVVAVFYNDYDAEAVLAAAPQQAAEPVAWVYETTHGRAVSFNRIPDDDLQKGTVVRPVCWSAPAVDGAVLLDAARYRWLRDNNHLGAWFSAGNSHMSYADNIDTDIDDAMEGG